MSDYKYLHVGYQNCGTPDIRPVHKCTSAEQSNRTTVPDQEEMWHTKFVNKLNT